MTSPRELAHATDALAAALGPYVRRETLARPLAAAIAQLVDEALSAEALGDVAAALLIGADGGEWETANILEEMAMHLHQQTLRRAVRG